LLVVVVEEALHAPTKETSVELVEVLSVKTA
jgi:hypothetical protein